MKKTENRNYCFIPPWQCQFNDSTKVEHPRAHMVTSAKLTQSASGLQVKPSYLGVRREECARERKKEYEEYFLHIYLNTGCPKKNCD